MPNLVVDSTGNDLTYRIIGAAMHVHNSKGYGFKEEVYEEALAVELARRGIAAERQYPLQVFHENEPVALFYLDLFVENQVIVEVKALSHLLTNDELAQVINYLQASGASVALLFNFGRRKLEYKRIFPPSHPGPVQRLGRDDVIRK